MKAHARLTAMRPQLLLSPPQPVGPLTPLPPRPAPQVLDAATGAALWLVPQPPLGIYSYTPTLLAGGEAAAVHNCLDLLASNSLCVYSRSAGEAGAAGRQGGAGATVSMIRVECGGAAGEEQRGEAGQVPVAAGRFHWRVQLGMRHAECPTGGTSTFPPPATPHNPLPFPTGGAPTAAGGDGPTSGGGAAIGGLPALGWWFPALGGRALALALAAGAAAFLLLF